VQHQPYRTVHDEDGQWYKSGFSNAGGSCVEVNASHQVRDTKNRHGGRLQLTAQMWSSLFCNASFFASVPVALITADHIGHSSDTAVADGSLLQSN